MNTKKRQEVRECHHCGNETLMNQELKKYFEIDEQYPFSVSVLFLKNSENTLLLSIS